MLVPKEARIKEKIGVWLADYGCLIYDERKNPRNSKWGIFNVENAVHGRPDLVVRCGLKGSVFRYVAIEVKPCYKHKDLLDGFDAVLKYFCDHCFGAKYNVCGEPIEIHAFVLATNFSPQGYLWEDEKENPPTRVKGGRGGWDCRLTTFTFVRLLWRQRDNLLKRILGITEIPRLLPWRIRKREFPEVGVLIRHPVKKNKVIIWTTENGYRGVEIETSTINRNL